ncbi:membrane protein YcaP [Escherichia coli]|uniref:Membrane protein YcaP n=1 Tax=Escherichia coli TaxID=562 RepID=A0A2X1IX68_ECOLX|nr:membrane protein YcaP [Escherichia coli]
MIKCLLISFGEVALRSLYTFVLVFLFLKMTGRRGVRQMSLFEVLIILTLGSAAGDVAFYDDVPMVPVLIVFITLAFVIPPGNVVDGAQ